MFGKNTEREHGTTTTTTHGAGIDPRARGGVAFGPILTGVVVAFGAMFLLSAVVGGVLASMGILETDVSTGEAVDAGIGAGIALVVAQFLSYLWGGYTAGRMARGSGVANGFLVPLTAIVVGLIVAGVATALGANANLNLPFTTNQLPLENDNLVNWGVGIGVATLVAMFLGGVLGGGMGARWHTKLERAHGADVDAHQTHDRGVADHREVDLRDADRRPVAAGRSGTVDEGVDLSSHNTHDTTDTGDTSTFKR